MDQMCLICRVKVVNSDLTDPLPVTDVKSNVIISYENNNIGFYVSYLSFCFHADAEEKSRHIFNDNKYFIYYYITIIYKVLNFTFIIIYFFIMLKK